MYVQKEFGIQTKTLTLSRVGGEGAKKTSPEGGREDGEKSTWVMFRQASLSVPIDRVGRLRNTTKPVFWRQLWDFVRLYSVRVNEAVINKISIFHEIAPKYTCKNCNFKSLIQKRWRTAFGRNM